MRSFSSVTLLNHGAVGGVLSQRICSNLRKAVPLWEGKVGVGGEGLTGFGYGEWNGGSMRAGMRFWAAQRSKRCPTQSRSLHFGRDDRPLERTDPSPLVGMTNFRGSRSTALRRDSPSF